MRVSYKIPWRIVTCSRLQRTVLAQSRNRAIAQSWIRAATRYHCRSARHTQTSSSSHVPSANHGSALFGHQPAQQLCATERHGHQLVIKWLYGVERGILHSAVTNEVDRHADAAGVHERHVSASVCRRLEVRIGDDLPEARLAIAVLDSSSRLPRESQTSRRQKAALICTRPPGSHPLASAATPRARGQIRDCPRRSNPAPSGSWPRSWARRQRKPIKRIAVMQTRYRKTSKSRSPMGRVPAKLQRSISA